MRIVQVAAIDMTHVKLLNTLNKKSRECGIDVHCISSGGNYTKDIKDMGFHFHEIEINREINPIKNIKSIISMVKVFKILKPDIVHVHTPVAAVLGRIAAKIANVPTVIYTAHGFYFHEGMSDKQYKIFFNIEKWVGRLFTDYIFTQSKEDFDVAVSNNFLKRKNRENYYHISNGIDLDEQFNISNISNENINNIKKRLGIKENDIVVSFIGRLVEEKGILDLLESYTKIKFPNVKFIIMGDLPKSERDLTAINLINKFKENPNIIFTGQIKNINEFLFMSDIFCLPSYREGMPRSIIEAMAMKNAVIATNIRGSREEVVEGETGYLVNLKSSDEIANYIDLLAANPEKLEAMKVKGLERAKLLYDENKVAEMQIDVFKKAKEGE